MIGLKVKITTRIEVTKTLELSAEQVEMILRNWAFKTQGFIEDCGVELTASRDMATGAIIQQTKTKEE